MQIRAQAEIDAVVGRDRFPTLDDKPSLPYIEAVCKEVMRWKMVTPMGTIQSSHDSVNLKDRMMTFRMMFAEGFFIPKGQIPLDCTVKFSF